MPVSGRSCNELIADDLSSEVSSSSLGKPLIRARPVIAVVGADKHVPFQLGGGKSTENNQC